VVLDAEARTASVEVGDDVRIDIAIEAIAQ
jgi:hypothetical protein